MLAIAFVAAGSMKVLTPRAELLKNPAMGWASDFSESQIKMIGAAEVVGAVGLVLPSATGIVPVLTPVAAAALAFLMGGAAATHLRRGEPLVVPLLLGVLALVVCYARLRK